MSQPARVRNAPLGSESSDAGREISQELVELVGQLSSIGCHRVGYLICCILN